MYYTELWYIFTFLWRYTRNTKQKIKIMKIYILTVLWMDGRGSINVFVVVVVVVVVVQLLLLLEFLFELYDLLMNNKCIFLWRKVIKDKSISAKTVKLLIKYSNMLLIPLVQRRKRNAVRHKSYTQELLLRDT
jgi:hypothetical protein